MTAPAAIYEGLTPAQAAEVGRQLLFFGTAYVQRHADGRREVLDLGSMTPEERRALAALHMEGR